MSYNGSNVGYSPIMSSFYKRGSQPVHRTVVYQNQESGLTYIGGASYSSPGKIITHDLSDKMIDTRAVVEMYMPQDNYLDRNYSAGKNYSTPKAQPEVIFRADQFLNPYRPATRWIGNYMDVKEIVEKLYKLTTGNELKDIEISILEYEEFRKVCSRYDIEDRSVQGFYTEGKVFVKQDRLDRMLIVIGHELGHSYSKRLSKSHLEEAKAYAFTEKWVEMIVEHNIENLSESINYTKSIGKIPEWAKEHLKGHTMFLERLKNGMGPMEIIRNLVALDSVG